MKVTVGQLRALIESIVDDDFLKARIESLGLWLSMDLPSDAQRINNLAVMLDRYEESGGERTTDHEHDVRISSFGNITDHASRQRASMAVLDRIVHMIEGSPDVGPSGLQELLISLDVPPSMTEQIVKQLIQDANRIGELIFEWSDAGAALGIGFDDEPIEQQMTYIWTLIVRHVDELIGVLTETLRDVTPVDIRQTIASVLPIEALRSIHDDGVI